MPGPQPRHYHPFIFCPVGRGLDPSATSRSTAVNGPSVGEKFIPPANLPPPPTSPAACGQAALRAPFVVRSVGRGLAPLRGVGDAAPYSAATRRFSRRRQSPRRPVGRPPHILLYHKPPVISHCCLPTTPNKKPGRTFRSPRRSYFFGVIAS